MVKGGVLAAASVTTIALASSSVGGQSLAATSTARDAHASTTAVRTQGAVVYTPATVVVPAALVQSELLSISPDGSTYTFKAPSGTLGSLEAGSVMFLQGKSVARVTGVARSGGRLIVRTAPVSVPDFIQSGTLTVSAPVSFGAGSFMPIAVTNAKPTVDAFERSTAPADQGTTSSGDMGGIRYTTTMDRGAERLGFTVDYGYDEDGLSGTIQASGYLDSFDAHMGMYVKNDLVHSSSFLARPLDGHVHLTWTLARDANGKETIKIPVVTPPIAWTVPFIAGGFPFFVKLEFQLKATVAISSKNSTLSGGVDLNYKGSGGGTSVSGGLDSAGSETVHGNFLTAHALTLGASGAAIAVDFPKLTLGMGFAQLNGNGTIEVITSAGQTTGSLIAGQACSRYDLDETIKAGLGAAIFKDLPSALLPSKVLYDKTFQYAQPGC